MTKKKNTIALSVPELQARIRKGIEWREVQEEDIDFSDIPRMTPEVLRRLKRVPKKKKAI